MSQPAVPRQNRESLRSPKSHLRHLPVTTFLRLHLHTPPLTLESLTLDTATMADEDLNLYDEIEIEDCFYDETLQIYHHPCPCGDRFEISIYDMRDGEDIARCPSCSLMIRIIFDQVRGSGEMPGGETWLTSAV